MVKERGERNKKRGREGGKGRREEGRKEGREGGTVNKSVAVECCCLGEKVNTGKED